MRKITLVRLSVASTLIGVAAAGGMLAAGCNGDDNNNGNPGGGSDASADGTQPSGNVDASPEAGTSTNDAGDSGPGSTPGFAKVLVVHASPDAPPLRLCFGVSRGDASTTTTIQPTFPAPNTAGGLPPGLGGPAAPPPSSLAGVSVTFYGIPVGVSPILDENTADAGATEKNCKDLLGGTLPGTDAGPDGGLNPSQYFNLGTVPAGTLLDGSSWLFAITGCTPNSPVATALPGACDKGGASYVPEVGNLGIERWQLDNQTTVAPDAIGAQFVHASRPFEVAVPNAVAATAGFYTLVAAASDGGTDAGDASADAGDAAPPDAAAPAPLTFVVAANVTSGSLTPATLKPTSGVQFDGTSGFFVLPVDDAGTPVQKGPEFPLPFIEQVSWPSGVPDGGAFQNGAGFVFVLLGNPAFPTIVPPAADAGPGAQSTFDPRGVHILGFPTNPPIAK
jgi:hypothetical protein